MKVLRLTHLVEEDPEFGTPARLVFNYDGMFFMGWEEEGQVVSWIDNPEEIVMLPLVGSIETRIPDLRLANANDYRKYDTIFRGVDQKVKENQEAIDAYVEEHKIEDKDYEQ